MQVFLLPASVFYIISINMLNLKVIFPLRACSCVGVNGCMGGQEGGRAGGRAGGWVGGWVGRQLHGHIYFF